jgi:hypothetical protein
MISMGLKLQLRILEGKNDIIKEFKDLVSIIGSLITKCYVI